MRVSSPQAFIVKKYGNRRLYDTDESRYVTLEELAAKIRAGRDARVLDAKSGEDLTQATLAQIILESRGGARLLPIPLLTQLIRMGDDALAEFMGRWVSLALEMYFQARQGAQALSPYVPIATAPFAATNALARMLLGASSLLGGTPPWEAPPAAVAVPTTGVSATPPPPPPELPPGTPPAPAPASSGDVEDLRRELAALREMLQGGKKPPRKRSRS
jgi:polyhydroxyalkanoate synthesis repressor PhaR